MSYKISLIKEYIWSIGTTSQRDKDLLNSLPKMLSFLEDFKNNQSSSFIWDEITQEQFGLYLNNSCGFKLKTNLIDKNARLKTSNLEQLGFLNEDRTITKSGEKLLDINNGYIKGSNFLQIEPISLLFLEQLFKMDISNKKNERISPIQIIIYFILCNDNSFLLDELKFIAPLIKSKKEAINFILSKKSYKNFIFDNIKKEYNIKEKDISNIFNIYKDKNEALLNIFPHGKGKSYVKPIIDLCNSCYSYKMSNNKKINTANTLIHEISSIKSKSKKEVEKFLTNEVTQKKCISKKAFEYFNALKLFKTNTYEEFVLEFLYIYLYSGVTANLIEYYDLNKRMIKTTNIFIFDGDYLKLDTIPFMFFNQHKEPSYILNSINNNKSDFFGFENLDIIKTICIKKLEEEIKLKYPNHNNYKDIQFKIKNEKFLQLLEPNGKLSEKQTLNILKLFKDRKNDEKIKKLLDLECEASTIFEYICGIWICHLSKGTEYLSYKMFNCSLDSSMLPIRFASGNLADIEFKSIYEKDILIEPTLMIGSSQAKNEPEPVKRHLGNYIHKVNKDAFSIFIATDLNDYTIDSLKVLTHHRKDKEVLVKDLKRIPLSLDNLIFILENKIVYQSFLKTIDNSIKMRKNYDEGVDWYYKEIDDIYK